ncbi:Uncharacterised protein [Klebsiella pneumoniae]|nr:Uncharacterised protein [Klebsiella pneumoniae]
MVNHNHPIAIAVVGNTQIGFFRQHARLQRPHVSGADLFVDVETVWLAAHRDNLGSQLAEDIRGDVIGRAVRAIHHHFQRSQAQFVGKGTLTKFNVAPRRIDDTAGFAQLSRIHAGELFLHFGFNRLFDIIRQFGALNGEEFNAVVVERVM